MHSATSVLCHVYDAGPTLKQQRVKVLYLLEGAQMWPKARFISFHFTCWRVCMSHWKRNQLNKHKTFTRRCSDVGPASQTMNQKQNTIGSMSRVYWEDRRWLYKAGAPAPPTSTVEHSTDSWSFWIQKHICQCGIKIDTSDAISDPISKTLLNKAEASCKGSKQGGD